MESDYPEGGSSNCDNEEIDNEIIKITDVLSSTALDALKEYLKINDLKNITLENDNEHCDKIALEPTDVSQALETLKTVGVVRINNILSQELCDECLMAVNHKLESAIEAGTDHFSELSQNGFGNIKPSEFRWDMFLDYSLPYSKALSTMMGSTETIMSKFYTELFQPIDAEWYEFGTVISDAGAAGQTLHPDTNFQALCPLYTMFIALQDISDDMGPTVFLPGTHTEEAHQHFHRRKEWFLANSEYRYGAINRGDAVIMDSRLFHGGTANTGGGRRAVLYFTQLNPRYKEANAGCTKFDYMKLPVQQIKTSKRN